MPTSIDPGHNFVDLLIAIVFLIAILAPSVFAFVAARRAKGVKDDVTGMKEDIATNHGKKPFEYLEMVAEVRDTQFAMRMDQLEIKELLAGQAEAIAQHQASLAEHTAQDEENFKDLKHLIALGPIEGTED